MRSRKYEYAQTLMDMLKEMPIKDITVTKIAERCHTTRQAFYYHFSDFSDLIRWTYMAQAKQIISDMPEDASWEDIFRRVLEWMKENEALVNNTYSSISEDMLSDFLSDQLEPIILEAANALPQSQELPQDTVQFVSRFYTLAINAVIFDWIRSGMERDPDELADLMKDILDGSMAHVLSRMQVE